jgi:cytoskeletal protein CcmA (bactofilin family)
VIRGRVTARTVAIARGAIVDGDIEVTSGEPVLEFEEKRGR